MKVSTVFTVKHDGKKTNYEAPGTGQEVIKNFRKGLAKGAVSSLRGFFVGEDKTFIPVNLNSI